MSSCPKAQTAVSFAIATSAVAENQLVTINTGTGNDNYRAPEVRIYLRPAGTPPPPASLSTVTLQSPSVLGGQTTTGTVTLTAPAPAGGASVWVNGSMEGQVVTPSGGVTVPAGSTSASFTITAPQVTSTYWVMIQASYGSSLSGMHGAVLRIDPSQPAVPDLSAMSVQPVSTVAGGTLQGTVELATPAPAGGTTVFLASSDPAAQVPSTVQIAAGNSTATFTVTTTQVSSMHSAQITAQSGSVTRGEWITIFPDPNGGAAQLSTLTTGTGSATGGTSISGTVTLSKAAPSGGASVTLSTSNSSAAQVPPIVTVPAGQSSASFTITTSAVAANTSVTITGTYGVSRSATITVLAGGGGGGTGNTGLRGPTANAADSGGDGNGFQSNPTNAYTDNSSSAVDTDSGTVSSTSCSSTGRDRHRFFNYGITIPAGASVKGIEVRLDARADSTSGTPRMCVELSWDGGATWTAAQVTSTLSTSLATRTLGGTANTWGRSWTAADLSNANFRVRVTNVASSTSRDFTLEWIAVRVTHSTP